jgi:hypothetical protein
LPSRSRRLLLSPGCRPDWRAATLGLAFLASACSQTLDAGHNRPSGPLPVDERNPVILYQDGWSGDWLGEYAVLFANRGGPPLVGIVIIASGIWGNLSINTSGWNDLVNAARSSGLENIPGVTPSGGTPLVRPADGEILSTTKNDSAGARKIIELSLQFGTLSRPVVVVSGTSLTDIADAYLVDQTVVDRVVVAAALGSVAAPNGVMGPPNGDLDPWASWIVAHRFRYVHVGTWYDQAGDVTTAQFPDLPANRLGMRFMDKRPNIITIPTAADQVALLAVALPGFVTGVQRASPDISAGFDPMQGLRLLPDSSGNAWVITQVAGPLAQARLWQMLLDPDTFGP